MNNEMDNNKNLNTIKSAINKLRYLHTEVENVKSKLSIQPDDLKLRKVLYSLRGDIFKQHETTHSFEEEMTINFIKLADKFKEHFLTKYGIHICFPILENMRSKSSEDGYPFFQTIYLNVKDDESSKVILQQIKTKQPLDISNLKFFNVNTYRLLVPEAIKDKTRREILKNFKSKYPEFDNLLYKLIEENLNSIKVEKNLVNECLKRQFQEYQADDFSPSEVHGKNDLTIL